MTEDLRCCGTGTCLINADGFCWCGQRWDGEKMSFPAKPGVAEKTQPDEIRPEKASSNSLSRQ